MKRLTKQDHLILAAIKGGAIWRPYQVAKAAGIKTRSPSETAARHLIKLTKLRLASQVGTRMFPSWCITTAGEHAASTLQSTLTEAEAQ